MRGIAPELFVQPTFAAAHPALAARFATTSLPIDRDWRGLRIAAEHTWLRARTTHADLVHHGGGTVPFAGSAPVLLTIHDLQYRQFPQYFSRARREYLSFDDAALGPPGERRSRRRPTTCAAR